MLIKKIKERTACIGVIGLGYVGLPLVQEFGKAGFPVIGLDVDPRKVERLAKGESYIRHIPSEGIAKMVATGKFTATTDFSAVSKCDCVLICVPTPLNDNREPDMSYIVKTAQMMAPYLKKDQLIVLESTTYPGTTQDVLAPELEKGSGLKANKDFFVAYSPERERLTIEASQFKVEFV